MLFCIGERNGSECASVVVVMSEWLDSAVKDIFIGCERRRIGEVATAADDVPQAPIMPARLLFMIGLSGAYYDCGARHVSYASLVSA